MLYGPHCLDVLVSNVSNISIADSYFMPKTLHVHMVMYPKLSPCNIDYYSHYTFSRSMVATPTSSPIYIQTIIKLKKQ